MAKLHDLKYELLEHPPYSPDLEPSDFHPFPKPKIFLGGQRFSSSEEAIAAVDDYFSELLQCHFKDGILALEHQWTKCVELRGDYVEK